MGKLKLKLEGVKQFLGKYSKKTLTLAGGGIVALIAAAIIIAVVLNYKEYVSLFSDVTEDEASQIVGKLQESGVDYQYKDNGDIMVPEDVADKTRANLVNDGFPKSGFTYDVFTQNAGGMTTDAEKQTYKLYDLQNRIGATIRLFDGVKDAKATIAVREQQKYVLEIEDEDKETSGSSASVVVTMKDGGSPSEKQASAIQRLVAKSVPDMEMENVAVFDGNGIEVSVDTGKKNSTSGDAGEEIAQLIETQISKKVMNVLGPFYGPENIRISARGKVNMERVVRESTTYNTPEKIDQNDKKGIVSSERTTRDSTGGAGGGDSAGGVAGGTANADQTEYNGGAQDGEKGSVSESATRDFLVNQIKEQGELDPGVLEDLTVSVSINGNSKSNISMNQLRDLVGNATGIAGANRQEKITIVNSPFYQEEEPKSSSVATAALKIKDYLPLMGVAGAVALVVILIALLFLKKLKMGRKEDSEELEDFLISEETVKPDILNLKNEKSRELRESVRGFAEENPEISAQMIRNWLNGGNQDGSSNPAE